MAAARLVSASCCAELPAPACRSAVRYSSAGVSGRALQRAAFLPAQRPPQPGLVHTRLRKPVLPILRSASTAEVATMPTTGTVSPAVLPGTPESCSIPEDRLIQLAKELFDAQSGVDNPDLLADDFRFEFPIVSLSKQEFVKAVSSFKLNTAFPDLDPHPYHWRVDPFEPNRVWFTTRTTGTHTGPLKFGNSTYKATNKVVQGAPEALSYTFNEDGKATSFTGGYIMDRRVGNTKKLGAVFGILAAIGAPVPEPGSFMWGILMFFNRIRSVVNGIVGSVFGKKED